MTTRNPRTVHAFPDGWGSDRLKDVVSLRNEKTDEASELEDYLELEDVESGTGRILNRRNSLAVESAVTLFKKGDVLFGKLRPYLEKYYEAEFDGRCTGEILAFKPERIEGPFLRYCVAAPTFIERCNTLAYGAKMPRVNWPTQLAQFIIPLPPPGEQRKIAAYLSQSCDAIDAVLEAKQKQIETLNGVRKSMIATAVTRGIENESPLRPVRQDWIDHVPSHWEVCRLKRVLVRMDYGISQSTNEEGRYPVLKMGNIQDGEIDFTGLDYVDDVESQLLLESGDLLYNRTNSPDQVGKAAIFRRSRSDEITFASYLVRLRAGHRALPSFLNYVLNSEGFLGFARRLAIPSVQQSNLNSTRYSRMFVPLPPLSEQEAIQGFLDEKVGEVNCVVAMIRMQMDTLLSYRKSLIDECVNGKRRLAQSEVNRMAEYA